LATLRDVADRVGVHPSTVSRALDPTTAHRVSVETRERVQSVAAEMDFMLDTTASGLRRGRSHTIGVIVPDLGNPYVAPTVRGIENSLESRGCMTFVTETQDDSARTERVVETMIARRVDAIITLAARRGDEEILRRARESVPIVLAIRDLPGAGYPGVIGDDERGGRIAADHLIDNGHTRLAQLHGNSAIWSFVRRGEGFVARATERGAEVTTSREAVAPSIDEGFALMESILESGPAPTAVFAHNDLLALGAIDAIRRRGLDVPSDISVIGYNDNPLTTHTDPPLTTVAMSGYELGRFSAEMALSTIEDPSRKPNMLSLLPHLVERESVAPAPETGGVVRGHAS
jgi:LacI family transcriptional regulator